MAVSALPREAKVRELADAANAGMRAALGDATAEEVFSAVLTLCASMFLAAQMTGVPVPVLRKAMQELWLRLPSDDTERRH